MDRPVKNFIIRLLSNGISVMFAAYFLGGVHLKNDSFINAILLAATLGILNALIKPLLILLTLPATIFTLGMFLLVINASIILLADWLLDEFKVDGFLWALLFSLTVTLISSLIERVLRKDGIIMEESDNKNESDSN